MTGASIELVSCYGSKSQDAKRLSGITGTFLFMQGRTIQTVSSFIKIDGAIRSSEGNINEWLHG
jgi:hypothetical protein